MEQRLYPFRGGPLDGRRLWIPETENRSWYIPPTVDGIWVGDRQDPLPEDLEGVDYRHEHYIRVGDEYVHETLMT
jgi:hypothetical protein